MKFAQTQGPKLPSRMIPGSPKDMGPPKMVSGTHTIPISLGILMGIVWEAYHKGVPCPWGYLKIPLIPHDLRAVWPIKVKFFL